MKITRIESLLGEKQAIVRVYTDDGVCGIGQTAPFQPEITVEALHRMVVPYFLGQNPWDLPALVYNCLRGQYKFTGTFLYRALCGVDTAIWDVLGQMTGQPVYRLLGGAVRTSIPVYASRMTRSTTPEEEVEMLQQAAAEHGFKAAKIKLGARLGAGWNEAEAVPQRTERLIPLMRQVMGDDFQLCADANGSYTAPEAIRVGRMLEANSYFHFEEPCPYTELDNMVEVARALDIPVAGGEQDTSLEQFQRLIQMRAVDILQADVGYVGGLTRARKIAALAENAGMSFTPHCANRSMLQIFTLHLAASSPACHHFQEWAYPGDGFNHIYEPLPQAVNGVVEMQDRPGWGVSLQAEYVKQAHMRVAEL